ncbi:hypothetical protein QVD17_25002 [Tagetes erecta]|uniref:Uncharacterized protein n=1 Tax=Tagetes erecta TaxID=13708 RepID=A0AAD8KG15_TARER|nr:hypothetical protein QVD17_25002 [Tagetes erecta]
MEKFLTNSVDVNKVWRRRSYEVSTVEGSSDKRKNMKTARFGGGSSRLSKIKKLFNMGSDEHRSSKIAASSSDFQSRLLVEIHKNTSASHELGSM